MDFYGWLKTETEFMWLNREIKRGWEHGLDFNRRRADNQEEPKPSAYVNRTGSLGRG
jgi:hypothetical protein